jgi:hypothetical protein
MNAKTKLKGVNKMQMPGFTAGASLYKAEGHYYTHGTSNQIRAAILPAVGSGPSGDCLDNCMNNCDPTGQDSVRCQQRCNRVCFGSGAPPPPPPPPPTHEQCQTDQNNCFAAVTLLPVPLLLKPFAIAQCQSNFNDCWNRAVN